MPSSPSKPIWYVYGIVPADITDAGLPHGLDGAPVLLERRDHVAALVSVLDGARYESAAMEANSGDVDWLSPRAVAHDLVLTSASDRAGGAVVPLPMFSLFSGRDAVQAMLHDRAVRLVSALARVREGREYALRMYRIDDELLPALTSFSPRLRGMADSAAAAAPGQRYLLERKLEAEKKSEVRTVSQRIIDDIMTELGSHALRSARSPIPRIAGADGAARGTMVLNAAFLIDPRGLHAFQAALTASVERYGQRGFRFDFTGPWPPYHFVNEDGHDE